MNDYLRTRTARRQSWFGLKLPVKTALAQPYLHPLLRSIAPRVKGLKIGRLPAPIALTEVRGRAGGADFYLVEPFRCEIAKEFYWGRGRRTEPEDAFALDLMVDLSSDAEVFLDIGAYTGVFTVAVLAANPRVRAHAFEIIPAVVSGLQKNLDRNGLTHRVTVHPTGVGSLRHLDEGAARRRGFGPALVLLRRYGLRLRRRGALHLARRPPARGAGGPPRTRLRMPASPVRE
jgi:hypothetical protein